MVQTTICWIAASVAFTTAFAVFGDEFPPEVPVPEGHSSTADLPPLVSVERPIFVDEAPDWMGAESSNLRYLSLSVSNQIGDPPSDPCCLCDACRSRPHTWIGRHWNENCKPELQRSHWGYCNYFQPRRFGDSLATAIGRQVQKGSIDQLALYAYDFYPHRSLLEHRLTPRGEDQLMKILDRLSLTPAPIKIQRSGDDLLDERRRTEVAQRIRDQGLDLPADQFVVFEPKYRTSAAEAKAAHQIFQQMIQARGRTIQGGGGATFSGGATFGQ